MVKKTVATGGGRGVFLFLQIRNPPESSPDTGTSSLKTLSGVRKRRTTRRRREPGRTRFISYFHTMGNQKAPWCFVFLSYFLFWRKGYQSSFFRAQRGARRKGPWEKHLKALATEEGDPTAPSWIQRALDILGVKNWSTVLRGGGLEKSAVQYMSGDGNGMHQSSTYV